VIILKFNEQGVLTNVGGDALELEGLEAGPAKKGSVRRSEFPKALGDILVIGGPLRLLFRAGHLSSSVLADRLVRSPVCLLAFRRLGTEE
jgi:hypothetical protein